LLSLHSILGIAIVVGLIALAYRRDDEHREDSCCSDGIAEGVVERCGPDEGDWCSLLERVSGAHVLCFDNTLQLVSMGPGAEGITGSIPSGIESGSTRLHLMDVVPPAAQAKLLESAAAARRGIESSARIIWDGIEFEASCVGISEGWLAILLTNGGGSR